MRTKQMIQVGVLSALLIPACAFAAGEDLWDRGKLQYPPLREVKLPDVERIALGNGMVLYLLEDREFPVVQGRMLIRAGAMLEPADKIGLAATTGTVLRSGGSARFPGDELDRLLEGIGASVEFGLGSSEGSGSFWSLKENATQVLEIFADLVRRPAFPEEKLELAKVSLRREIAGRNDEPMDILMREMGKLIWGKEHPYARHTEYATVDAVTRDDLVAFHRDHFHPDRIYLTVWGDIDAKAMRKQIEKHFGDWKRSGAPAPGQPEIAPIVPGGALAYAEKKGTTNTWVVMGHVGLRGDHPDYPAMTVMGEILGGGFSSRLFNEIRTKRGLAYAAGSTSGTDIARPGVFLAYAGTRSDSALVVLDYVRHEVRRITKEPVTEEELKLAKDAILNSYVFQFASKGQIATRMAFLNFHGYPDDFTARYPEQVKALTAADILGAAQRNLHPDDLQVLLVGNEADFAKPLASLGASVQRIDLTIPEPAAKEEIPAATPANLAEGKRLLARAAEATGGTAAWGSIKDMTQDSEINATIQGMSLKIVVQTVQTADGKDYVKQVLPFGEVILARSGGTGWKKTPAGLEDLTETEMAELDDSRARDLWAIFAGLDKIEGQSIGRRQVAGKQADAILLKGPGLKNFFLFLDPSSGEPLAARYQGKSPGTGAPVQTTEVMSDFRSVGPVRLPHATEILHDGELFAKGIVRSASVNAGVDEARFAKPE